jgi:hypothetical protein
LREDRGVGTRSEGKSGFGELWGGIEGKGSEIAELHP